ncbi:hypothetical protein Poli38472_014344 [Pythium oligandrum]|uniref:WRKY19-like zinc finger domain-containing protein n=1 Tax=Pythium oligandrum TaxID=41045 RepID=A0A8K1C6X9_PYTOL|nr:hypothetical protein Poli38472_014344 [Pythium oligandrum]|eukprot:TMW57741.1 hypothetical protein Poli38472_014344 [Pythium oligandrum]
MSSAFLDVVVLKQELTALGFPYVYEGVGGPWDCALANDAWSASPDVLDWPSAPFFQDDGDDLSLLPSLYVDNNLMLSSPVSSCDSTVAPDLTVSSQVSSNDVASFYPMRPPPASIPGVFSPPSSPRQVDLPASFPTLSPRRVDLPALLPPVRSDGNGQMIGRHGEQQQYKNRESVRLCKVPGCVKNSQSHGRCIRHGGGKRCAVDGCPRGAQARGKCKAHGGGMRCKVDGCVRSSQGSGLCRSHGGGKLCDYPGCTKGTQRHGKCSTHAGVRRCSIEGCDKADRGGGFCRPHKMEQLDTSTVAFLGL